MGHIEVGHIEVGQASQPEGADVEVGQASQPEGADEVGQASQLPNEVGQASQLPRWDTSRWDIEVGQASQPEGAVEDHGQASQDHNSVGEMCRPRLGPFEWSRLDAAQDRDY